MPNALASSAVLPHHPSQTGIVDLRSQLYACPVDDRPAWSALQLTLQEATERHSHELHIDRDTDWLKLRTKTFGGFVENRLNSDDHLNQALQLLELKLWPDEQSTLGRRTWFMINLGQHDFLFQLDHVKASGGCSYTFRCLYDIQNPLPQLDQLITLPRQAMKLRKIIDRSQGLVLLADSDRVSRVQTARALAQDMASPNRRILLSETTCHPLVPGTTQITLPLHAQREHYQAWHQACDMSHDIVIALELDHEPTRLAQLASEGSLVIQGVGASSASQALAQLIASGVRPEAIARSLTSIVVQHQIALLCEDCKCPSEANETLNEWIGVQNPIHSGSIQGWLAERMSDKFMQANGCEACKYTGISEVILTVDYIEVGHDIQDSLCDGDVRYAMQALSKLETHARQLVLLARSGKMAVSHAIERLERIPK